MASVFRRNLEALDKFLVALPACRFLVSDALNSVLLNGIIQIKMAYPHLQEVFDVPW